MRVHTRCSYCKAGVSHYTIYDTRAEYDMRKGTKYINIQCKKCLNTDDYHLNDLRAVRSPFFGLVFAVSIIAGLVGTFLLSYYTGSSTYQWTVLGMFAGVPFIATSIMFRQNIMKVNAFNQNFLSE